VADFTPPYWARPEPVAPIAERFPDAFFQRSLLDDGYRLCCTHDLLSRVRFAVALFMECGDVTPLLFLCFSCFLLFFFCARGHAKQKNKSGVTSPHSIKEKHRNKSGVTSPHSINNATAKRASSCFQRLLHDGAR
jgi:hypothetical protein